MKILIVSQYYYPEQFQINEIAPELVKRGHEITVLTGLPNYPKGEIFDGYEKEHRDEIIDGVHVIRVEARPRKKGGVNLVRNYLSYARKAKNIVKKMNEHFDVVLCYQLSPVTMLEPAIEYAKRNNVPLIAYCLDIWPESARAHLNFPFVYHYIKKLSIRLYNSCDHIAVTSRPFIDYLYSEIGYDKAKMSYIPQHADEALLNEDLNSEDNGIVDFMYAGNMGKGQTLDVIIRAAAEITEKEFLIHMVGEGSQKGELEELTKTLCLQDKIIFHGNQKREYMPYWYKKADALLITLRGDNAVGNTMPGKLQAYMTTGRPVLGAINGAAAEVIDESRCGKCVNAGDYKGLSELMLDFIENPNDYANCGKNASVYFKEHFTLKRYCDDLEHLLESMI